MSEFLFHVGHGRTGSSYIQSAFARSVDRLAERNIVYPDLNGSLENAGIGKITSGNIRVASDTFERQIFQLTDQYPDRRILLSSEKLFGFFRSQEGLRQLMTLAEGPHSASILCLTRDPVSHAVSTFVQSVKGGRTSQISEHLLAYHTPLRVIEFLRQLDEIGIPRTVLRFESVRTSLLAALEEWLEIPEGSLEAPRPSSNRSLVRSEIELQRRLNERLDRKAAFRFANALAENEITAEKDLAFIPESDLANFLYRMQGMIETCNAELPEHAHYQVPDMSECKHLLQGESDVETFVFTQEQLEALARAIILTRR